MPLSETAQLVVNMNLKGDFRQGMKGAQKDLRGFTTQANQTTGRLGRLGAKLRSPELKAGLLQGVGLTGGLIGFQLLGTAVSGAVNYMGDALSAASDLTEAQSKVDEVFEDSAPTVRRWASTLESSFGISERAALSSAGTLGNFLVALGQTENAASGMSTSIVELAGDLASFNNVASSDVLVALQAGLAGETEPVRRLGIDISAARVEALLLAQGIEKVNGEFTQSQKVQGRYLAIMQDTEKAQGDAARTSDELAGQQRQLDANTENLSASTGKLIEGPATDFTSWLVDASEFALDVAENIPKMGEAIDDFGKEVERNVTQPAQDALQPINDLFGRDVVNDFTNGARIFSTGGLILISDNFDNLTGAAGDAAEAVFGFEEAESSLLDITKPIPNVIYDQAIAVDEVAASSRVVTRQLVDFTDAARALNRTFSETTNIFSDFREEADGIADTRSLGKINDEIDKQVKLRRIAAKEGRVADFAAAEAAIARLKEERRLRRLGKQALKDFKNNKGQEAAAQQLVTNKIANSKKEARKLLRQTRKKYGIKVTVDSQQLADAISRAKALGTALSLIQSTVISGVTGIGKPRQSGGPVQAGRAYVVGEQRPELFVPNQNGRIVPNVPSGGGDISVYVTPSLVVAAAQVEDQTTKAVRTQRFREKN